MDINEQTFIPIGNFQLHPLSDVKTSFVNYDIIPSKNFVKILDHKILITKWPDRKFKLNEKIYQSPSNCPLIDVHDVFAGSAYEDFFVPSGHWNFEILDDRVNVTLNKKDIKLEKYIDQIYEDLDQSVLKIFSNSNNVLLPYSGGIDTFVLLSFIVKHNFLYKTKICIIENFTQNDLSCIHKNIEKKQKISESIDVYKKQYLDVIWLKTDLQNIKNTFMNGNFDQLRCYSTAELLSYFKNQDILFGTNGNHIFLHNKMFIDEIVIQQPEWRDKILDYIKTQNNFYTKSIENYNSTEFLPIERRHILYKVRSSLNGFNGNILHEPILSTRNQKLYRTLDYKTVHPDIILNATVAREIINRNVGNALDDFITTESLKDFDNLEEICLDINQKDYNLLKIPKNLSHNERGLDYVNYIIEQAKITGKLPINSAVIIKCLQHIDMMSKKVID